MGNLGEEVQTVGSTTPWQLRPPWVIALAGAGITCLVGVYVAGRLSLGPIDDAYISLRYATNWAGGAGLSFNSGENVEGYTNSLLVLMEAAAIRCGLDPVVAMRVIGWVSLAGLAGAFTLFAARRLFRTCGGAAVPLGIVVCLNPMFICWAASGMETCLYAALVLISVMFAVESDHKSRPALSGVCLALAGMTRPEAAMLLPVLASVIYSSCRSVRQTIRFVSVFVVGFGVYFAIRAWHFGHLFPNTFYAKVDYGSLFLLRRGLVYTWGFILAMPLLFALCIVALALLRRAPLSIIACALAAGVQMLVVIVEGGDHFAMFRFMVPILPLLSALALYPCVYLIERFSLGKAMARRIALIGMALVAVSNLTVCRTYKRDEPEPTTQLNRFALECRLARVWSAVGDWFGDNSPPDASLATIAIGAIGFHSGLTIIDPYGIVDPVIAHQQRRLGTERAGHEKFDIEYVLSKRPSYMLLANLPTPQPLPAHRLPSSVWGKFNRKMLESPRLAADYDYRSIRVDRGFLNLHVRRDQRGS